MERIAGLASFFINGAPASFEGALKYQPNSTTREPKMAGDGSIAGYKETGLAPYISVTLYTNNPGMASSQLYAMSEVYITAQLANGGTVTGHSMTMMEPPEPNNDEGTMECKWIGPVNEAVA